MKSRQQLLSQNDKLLQALRVELKVYEKLDEEHRKPQRGTVCSGPGLRHLRAMSSPKKLFIGCGRTWLLLFLILLLNPYWPIDRLGIFRSKLFGLLFVFEAVFFYVAQTGLKLKIHMP